MPTVESAIKAIKEQLELLKAHKIFSQRVGTYPGVELPHKIDPPLSQITLLKNCRGDNIFKPLCGAFSL